MIEDVADRAVLDSRFVKGERERLLTRAFVIRAIVLMTLMPDAGIREGVTALAGDLAGVPWARPWRAASERALGDWRNALGPGPLEELRAIVLEASYAKYVSGQSRNPLHEFFGAVVDQLLVRAQRFAQ